MLAKGIAGRAALVAAGFVAASCVLVVSPATYGGRCKFEGEDTACGQCLRDRCQPAVDACCTDDACTPTLGVLESCITRKDASCDDLASRKARGGHDGDLATCATTTCGAVCRSFTGKSQTECKEPAFGRGATCACRPAPSAGNDFECSSETYPGRVCCAPEGWPADGLECTCQPLGCHPIPNGCSCALVDTPPEITRCGDQTLTTCCASKVDHDQCVCRDSCFDNERLVPSCSVTTQDANGVVIGCKKGQHRVASCTIRK